MREPPARPPDRRPLAPRSPRADPRPRRGAGRLSAAPLIAVALALFVGGGAALDRLDYFASARDTLRGQTGPAAMPDDGDVGRAVAAALERYGASLPFGRRPETMPSSVMLSADQLAGNLPVLSIVADEDYLDDPATGIMANMMETGPDWERLAWASLWEQGELVAASRVGLRIHGDSTRYLGDPSFRLHFRPMYGATARTGGRFLGPEARPAAAVVVHVVRYKGHYPNMFVFEIDRRLGLPTVAFRPARVFLNGADRGIYVLTERVMPDGWGMTHFGDPSFFMYVYKGETKRPSQEAHAELVRWVEGNEPLTLRRALQRIDVDNLTRHLFSLMFCFTTDWAQGAALLDRDDPEARWFWLHWDMDQSFDLRGIVDIEPWQQPFLELVTLEGPIERLQTLGIVTDERNIQRHSNDLRRLIFTRLLADPEYREYFVRLTTDILNHELTPDYFRSLVALYDDLAMSPGVYSRLDLGEFLRRRPDFVRGEVARYFELPDPVQVTVEAPPSTPLVVDGYAETGDYAGSYFPGQRVTIEAGAGAPPISGWEVGGLRVSGDRLELVVDGPVTIRPLSGERP